MQTSGMQFRLLGPLEVLLDGRAVPLGSPKEQAVLALLVLRAGTVVSADRLVEELWGEHAPRSAAKNLQTYVSHLRRRLRDAGGGDVVTTRSGGYELVCATEDVDATQLQRAVAQARVAAASDAFAAAAAALRSALGLWRGEPLTGLRFSPALAAEAERLNELHVSAVEQCIDAELALGRHPQLVMELGSLVAQHPLRERLWAQLMLALYRCGRQADALQAYQRARATLVDELGVDPGPELRALEGAILAQDPALAPPAAVVGDAADAPAAPLPPDLAAPHPLVGREDEEQQLSRLWQASRAGRTAVALLSGEPGIGKTRLAAALAQRARSEGGAVLYGRCDPEALIPFQPVVEALRQHVSRAPLSLLREHVTETGGQLRLLLPELSRRLPDVVAGLPPPSSDRYLLFDAVTSLLTAAARRQPLLLVLDDLHWADTATLLMLRHVTRLEQVPLLVVATYRDTELSRTHPLAETVSMLRRHAEVLRLHLRGLDTREVGVLAERLLPALRQPLPALAAQIHEETAGNPLFVREVLLHLAEVGEPPAPGARLVIPEGVRDAIGRRLSRLSEQVNAVLNVAAVVGQRFDVGVVAAAAGVDEDEVIAFLDAAVAAGLVVELPAQYDTYAFSHALVRSALREELTTSRRVRLHQRIAAALEKREAAHPDSQLAELSYHLGEAAQREDVDRAVAYTTRAGELAMRQLAYEDAAQYYRRALEMLELAAAEDPLRRAGCLLELGRALSQAGAPGASETLLEAAQLARAAGDARLLARVAVASTSSGASNTGTGAEVDLLVEAEQVLDEGDPLLVDVLAARATWLSGVAEREQLTPLSRRSLELARRTGDRRVIARATAARLFVLALPREADERLALADELAEQASDLGDASLAALARRHRIWALLDRSDYAAASREIEQHEAAARRIRDRMAEAAVEQLRVMRWMLEGRFAAAEEVLTGGPPPERRALMSDSWRPGALFILRWMQGRLAEAEPLATAMRREFPDTLHFATTELLVLAAAGRADEARAALQRIAPHGCRRALRENWLWSVVAFHLACAAPLLGDAERADELYDVLLPDAGRSLTVTGRMFLGAVDYHLGRLAQTAGRPESARAHLHVALALHSAAGSPPWVQLAEQALAELDAR